MYADVIVDITHEKLDKIFQYLIPKEMEAELKVGTEVLVPFGNGNRAIQGVIVGISGTCNYAPEKMKAILRKAPGRIGVESGLVELAAWMREVYGGTMIQALRTVLPVKKEEHVKEQRILRRIISEDEGKKKLEEFLRKHQSARARLMAILLDREEVDYSQISKEQNITLSVVRALEQQNILEIVSKQIYRNPIKDYGKKQREFEYTEEQKEAIRIFSTDYDCGKQGTYLLYGVTGSGKTEVYMEMIRHVIASGKQAIVLIPEIALTYQTVMRFYREFGERVSVMNSRLSAGERYDQMMRAKEGKIDVMIGPRSALFTPFQNIGLIVIDEEHELAYKSEQVPRYHAREVAVKRAELEGASVVLGSATPSVEAFYRCKKGEYRLLTLKNRAAKRPMPKVDIVDMREELKKGNKSVFSDSLRLQIAQRLQEGQQTILFLNRRGYAGFLSCRSCGYVVKCPHCDVSLSSHKNGKMVCHYCGYEERKPELCPECGSVHMGSFRAGTQQIEDLVKKEFPGARVLRMDLDTTRTKDGYENILSAFAKGEADILVGTQMIVKGHDFPNVTLVGILAADMSLYADDYRAAERTFELLTQAAGRAGRGNISGEVVIQTYSPEHYSIQLAAQQDYDSFYEEEISYRDLMGYPPVEHMLAILVTAEEEELVEKGAYYLKEYMKVLSKKREIQIIGPASPPVSKIKDVFRRVLYLKAASYDVLINVKDCTEQYIEINKGFAKMRIQFDFDPVKGF